MVLTWLRLRHREEWRPGLGWDVPVRLARIVSGG